MPWSTPSSRATSYKVTAANWNELVANFAFLAEIGYAEVTAPASVTTTSVGAAVQLVTLGAITYEAAPTLVEFYCPRISIGTSALNLVIRDGTTVIGTLSTWPASANPGGSSYFARRFTPSAASHSYNAAAWLGAAGTTTFQAGTGGAAGDNTTYLAMWIRATRIPT